MQNSSDTMPSICPGAVHASYFRFFIYAGVSISRLNLRHEGAPVSMSLPTIFSPSRHLPPLMFLVKKDGSGCVHWASDLQESSGEKSSAWWPMVF